MQTEAFRAFTAAVVARLQADHEVLGVVGLGSTADAERVPDDHSDHDLWIVTRPGAQERLRASQAWLPDVERIALAFRETEHGVKVLYDCGHLVEYAVFSLDELAVARSNVYRVFFDCADVEARVAATARPPPGPAAEAGWLFGQALSHLLLGAERAARGERLSGHRFVRELAVARLLELIVKQVPPAAGAQPDDLDPYRRLERTHPAWAAELDAALQLPILPAAVALLGVLDRLADAAPASDDRFSRARAAVRGRLARLAARSQGS